MNKEIDTQIDWQDQEHPKYFWREWFDNLVEAGYPEEYIEYELNKFQAHEKNWPEGKDDYRQTLIDQVFNPAIEYKHKTPS